MIIKQGMSFRSGLLNRNYFTTTCNKNSIFEVAKCWQEEVSHNYVQLRIEIAPTSDVRMKAVSELNHGGVGGGTQCARIIFSQCFFAIF